MARSAMTKAQQDAEFIRIEKKNTQSSSSQAQEPPRVPDEVFMRRTAAQERIDASYLRARTQFEMHVPPLRLNLDGKPLGVRRSRPPTAPAGSLRTHDRQAITSGGASTDRPQHTIANQPCPAPRPLSSRVTVQSRGQTSDRGGSAGGADLEDKARPLAGLATRPHSNTSAALLINMPRKTVHARPQGARPVTASVGSARTQRLSALTPAVKRQRPASTKGALGTQPLAAKPQGLPSGAASISSESAKSFRPTPSEEGSQRGAGAEQTRAAPAPQLPVLPRSASLGKTASISNSHSNSLDATASAVAAGKPAMSALASELEDLHHQENTRVEREARAHEYALKLQRAELLRRRVEAGAHT